jgi:tetratricopeptide (TPR) repeat protein
LAAYFPAVPDYRQFLAASHNNLGSLFRDLGRTPEAEERYRKALAIQEKLVADFPAVPLYRWFLAAKQLNLGVLLAGLGKRAEAEEQYRKALAIYEKLAADFPALSEYRKELANANNNLGLLLADLGKRPEAEEQYRKALAISEKLAADFPNVPQYRVDLGGSYCNFGLLVSDGGEPGESLKWFEKAIPTLTAVYEQDRRAVLAKQFLRNSHVARANTYDRLRKFTEAIKDWDMAIELSPEQQRGDPRSARAKSRLQAGQVAEAVAEVAELTKNPTSDAGQLYGFARVYSIASGKSSDRTKEYADRAIDLLQKAVKAGWNNAAYMSKDTDLDPIRERDDFKKLVDELAKKAPGTPSHKP